MSDEPTWDRSGIHIDRDLAESIAIEEELDSTVLSPYSFPPPSRRRTSAYVYLAGAVVLALTVDGGWVPALGLVALAGWHLASSWPLTVGEGEAMVLAGKSVPFPVGHASGAITFKGWRSRPRWAVILYSASEPPDKRGLVVVDAVEGGLAEDVYVEDIPPA